MHDKNNLKQLLIIFLAFFVGIFTACNPPPYKWSESDIELSIMTWNVYQGTGSTSACIEVLSKKKPDILGLQESNAKVYTEVIAPFIAANSEYAVANSYLADANTRCSTPILFNTEKFTLLDSGTELLDQGSSVSASKSLAWVVLETIDSSKIFSVINFHGAVCRNKYAGFESYSEEEITAIANNWRKDNARQVVAKGVQLSERFGDMPIMIMGDCNFNSESEPYSIVIAADYHEAEKTAMLSADSGTKSTHVLGESPTSGITIDHIFGNNQIVFLIHQLLNDVNTQISSDHSPVYAEVHLGLENNRR